MKSLRAVAVVALAGAGCWGAGQRDPGRAAPAGKIEQALAATVLATSPGATRYAAQNPPTPVDPNLTLAGEDALDGAAVAIGSGFVAGEDVLSFTPSGGVTGSYDAATGILTLTGSAGPATYQAVLRSVSYANTGGAAPSLGARSIRFSLVTNLLCASTGHFYEYVPITVADWGTAMAAAAARTRFGLRGYLATVTSAEESACVRSRLVDEAWMGAMATKTPLSPSSLAGDYSVPRTWYWVTGPEAGTAFYRQDTRCAGATGTTLEGRYANWSPGEPNDLSFVLDCSPPGVEAFANFYRDGTWNDYRHDSYAIRGYIAEYGGMAGDPTPVFSAAKSLEVVVRASMALTSSVNPSVSGQPVRFRAEISPSSATGAVQFRVDGADLGAPAAVASGAATSPEVSALTAASHQVQAVYSGDSAVSGATAALSQTVEKARTFTALSSAVNPTTYGQGAVLTATVSAVSPGSGTPTGSVELFEGVASLGTAPLSGGRATLTVSSLSAGAHALTALYSGDSSFLPSTSASLNQGVNRATPSVQLSSSMNPSVWGQTVRFTAALSPASATGVVAFFDGATPLGTAAVASGAASISTAALGTGAHAISARYGGDANFTEALSGALTQAVNKAPAGLALAASPSASVFGQAVVLTATAAAGATGAVTFHDGIAALGTATLASGRASLSISTLLVGSHALGASYGGDANHESGSASASAQVAKAASATTLSSSLNPCLAGQTVALTAAVAAVAPGAAEPTGAIEFFDGAASLGTAPLAAGKAQLTTPPLAVGSHALSARYGGDARLLPSAAGPLAQGVSPSCRIDSAIYPDGATNPANPCQICAVGTSTTAWANRPLGFACTDDGSPETDDYCDLAGACVHPPKNRCAIGGASYASGAANPENPCQFCDPSAGAFQWTLRPAGYACPSDGLTCTRDACDGAGTCGHDLASGCLIDGQCAPAGALDPANDCRACNPAVATSRYSPRAKGEVCADDGDPSTLDACDGRSGCAHAPKGQCTIDGQAVEGGAANPANACQACDPATSASGWTNRAQGFSCADDGLACTSDACDGAGACQHTLLQGCLLAGACVEAGALEPINDCRACIPALSTGAFSPRAKGAVCGDDGDPATLDVCDGASCTHPAKGLCVIGGVIVQAGSPNPENPCQACDPAASATAWTNRVSGYPCATDGLSCTLDACDGSGACGHPVFEGCLIGGGCTAAGAADPANECAECNPALARGAFSPKPKGTACADDGKANTLDVCDGAGACSHPFASPCTIAGVLYGGGDANPENPCEVCDAAANPQGWSPRASGFACASDGLACTLDACDGRGVCQHSVLEGGCLIAGACVAQGAADPASECRVCDPAAATASYTLLSNADCLGACQADVDCTGGAFCLSGVCRPPRPGDSPCAADDQCPSGLCKAGICAGVAMVGGCGCGAAAGAELPAALMAAALLGGIARRQRGRGRAGGPRG